MRMPNKDTSPRDMVGCSPCLSWLKESRIGRVRILTVICEYAKFDCSRSLFFPVCRSASKERREQSERTKLTVVMTELAPFFIYLVISPLVWQAAFMVFSASPRQRIKELTKSQIDQPWTEGRGLQRVFFEQKVRKVKVSSHRIGRKGLTEAFAFLDVRICGHLPLHLHTLGPILCHPTSHPNLFIPLPGPMCE